MENVGCVTFTEHYIFQSRKLYVDYLNRANTIFHEMVHMWFGNLVTMKWWNGIWLNEAFATFMATKAVADYKKEWNRWAQFSLEKSCINFNVPSPIDLLGLFTILSNAKSSLS